MKVDRCLVEFIARQALSGPYRQTGTMTTRKLEDFLKDRGITLQWESIHHLWEVGILHPIAILPGLLALRPTLPSSGRVVEIVLEQDERVFVDLGIDVTEEMLQPRPDTLSGHLRDQLLWHPFQLWQFEHMATVLDVSVQRDTALKERERYLELVRFVLSLTPGHIVSFAQSNTHSSFLHLLALLLCVDPLVHVDVFHSHTCNLFRESPEAYFPWIAAQDGAAWLAAVKLDTDEVRLWHERLSLRGQMRDPFGSFRTLVRLSNRNERKRLRGEGLLAQDFYDAAQNLRTYLHRYHAVTVPEELRVGRLVDPDAPPVSLRDEMRRLGLDPQERVVWFLEGETEMAYVEAWCAAVGIDLRSSGVELRNAEGTGFFAKRSFRDQLAYLQREEIYAYVSVDRDANPNERGRGSAEGRESDPTHIRELKQLEADKRLPIGFKEWRGNFVEANFTLAEVTAIARKMAEDAGCPVDLSIQEIEQERLFKPDGNPRGTKGTVEEAIKRLLERKAKFPWGKGTVWGEALADWAHDHPWLAEDKQESTTLNDDKRPITQVILMLMLARSTSYDLSVELHKPE